MQRQTNIELCRVITMLMILAVHSTYQTFGTPGEWDNLNFSLILLHYMTIIGVNVFTLITGYFSTTLRLEPIIRICFRCLYYGLVVWCTSLILGVNLKLSDFLFVSKANWYISSYFGLLFFTPILNAFVESIDKRSFKKVLLFIFMFQIWYDYIPKEVPNFYNGYSILSLITVYLLGRYLRIYGIPSRISKYKYCIYLLAGCITATICYVCYLQSIPYADRIDLWLRKYNNPILIVQSIAFLSIFINAKMKPSKLINHISKSSLSVLIAHTSIVLKDYYSLLFINVYKIDSKTVKILAWGGNYCRISWSRYNRSTKNLYGG